MDAQTPSPEVRYALGRLLTEGKTKWIHQEAGNADLVIVLAKDDVTAVGGPQHDAIVGRSQHANRTTCNAFQLLGACGIPVAFTGRRDATSFVATKCRMLPYRVVVRREAHGAYLKRHPHLSEGQLFPKLVVELFLKTKDGQWRSHKLVRDNPLMSHVEDEGQVQLLDPEGPGSEPWLTLPEAEVFGSEAELKAFPEMQKISRQAFLVLEKAWQLEGQKLVDLRLDFGFDSRGNLVIGDAIDNDSWHVVDARPPVDAREPRDGDSGHGVALGAQRAAELTDRFHLPRQRIILWRGSESDNVEKFLGAVGDLGVSVFVVTCSAHKEPVAATLKLHQMVQEVPDSLVIAYIGRSNGAGPTLSAMSTVPVITVPASVKEFPNDVWSSLRAPSKVPVMTVLEPSNAILAALQIFSARNPRVYAHVRAELEARTVNVTRI